MRALACVQIITKLKDIIHAGKTCKYTINYNYALLWAMLSGQCYTSCTCDRVSAAEGMHMYVCMVQGIICYTSDTTQHNQCLKSRLSLQIPTCVARQYTMWQMDNKFTHLFLI